MPSDDEGLDEPSLGLIVCFSNPLLSSLPYVLSCCAFRCQVVVKAGECQLTPSRPRRRLLIRLQRATTAMTTKMRIWTLTGSSRPRKVSQFELCYASRVLHLPGPLHLDLSSSTIFTPNGTMEHHGASTMLPLQTLHPSYPKYLLDRADAG